VKRQHGVISSWPLYSLSAVIVSMNVLVSSDQRSTNWCLASLILLSMASHSTVVHGGDTALLQWRTFIHNIRQQERM